jgi:enoyl-CoA hydratase/carnithine racemase
MDRLVLLKNQLAGPAPAPITTIPYTKLIVDIYENNIGVISLNSPKDLNSLSKEMRTEIVSALKQLEQDPKIKVVILTSKVDKIFCAGANIKEFPKITYESQILEDPFLEYTTTLDKFKKPLIAAINGGAFGGGFELALHCDIIVCTDDAKLGLPELKLGLMPGFGGTQRLYRILGKYLTMKTVLTSEPITGLMAKTYGLAVAVYNKEELLTETLKLAKKISDKSIAVLILAKEALKKGDEVGLDHGIQMERLLFNSLFALKASKEGVSAFIDRRTPNFKDL